MDTSPPPPEQSRPRRGASISPARRSTTGWPRCAPLRTTDAPVADERAQPHERRLRLARPIRLDPDGLARFAAAAGGFVHEPVTVAIAVVDGGRATTFWSIDEFAGAPFVPDRLDDAGVTIYGAIGTVTLAGHDGIADLVVSGPEIWSYGAAAALADELELYGAIVEPPQRETPGGGNALSAGGTALALGVAWFLLDMGLDELGGLLSPPAPPALELRTVPSPPPAADTVAPFWTAAPYLVAAGWVGAVLIVVAYLVPRVHS